MCAVDGGARAAAAGRADLAAQGEAAASSGLMAVGVCVTARRGRGSSGKGLGRGGR